MGIMRTAAARNAQSLARERGGGGGGAAGFRRGGFLLGGLCLFRLPFWGVIFRVFPRFYSFGLKSRGSNSCKYRLQTRHA